MKDEQRVYIRGVENRGNEVIETLKKLGGINRQSLGGGNKYVYYYINPKGAIDYGYVDECSPEHLLVKEFYREITLPKEKNWEDGDLLVQFNGVIKEYMVYSHDVIDIELYAIMTHIWISDEEHSTYTTRLLCDASNAKIASKDDINDFQKLLHEHGKEWDFKNKKLIDWRWKPENNEDYWYINDVGEICHTSYNQFMIRDNKHVAVGNCFKTEVDAFAARLRIKEMLLNK